MMNLFLLAVILTANVQMSVSGQTTKITAEASSNIVLNCDEGEPVYSLLPTYDFQAVWKFKPKNEETLQSLHEGVEKCASPRTTECSNGNTFSILKLGNISFKDSGSYTCYLRKNGVDTRINKTSLTVGYPPSLPVYINENSTLDFKKSVMTFCWNIQNLTYIPTTYNMRWHNSTCRKKGLLQVCCRADIKSRFELQRVALMSNNTYGSVISLQHEIVPSLHIKPPPPKNLSLDARILSNTNEIIMEWKSPDLTGFIAFDYKIRFSELKPNGNWTTERASMETSHTLENLKSSTAYIAQVSAKPNPENGVYAGVWSDWSQPAIIRTGVTVPTKRFSFSHHNITVSHLNGTYYSVDIYWHSYEFHHEDGFYNRLSCGTQEKKTDFKVYSGSKLTFNTASASIICNGAYCNDAGCSKNTRYSIDMPKADITTPEAIFVNLTHLVFNWKNNKPADTCTVRICSGYRSESLDYDYEISEYDPYDKCYGATGGIESHIVDCSSGEFKITSEWSSCFYYIVVMEVLYESENLRIRSEPSESIIYDQYFEPDNEFRVSVVDSSHIMVSWSNSTRYESSRLHQIEYTPRGGPECDRNVETTCQSMYHTVSRNATSAVLSKNIYGGQVYNFREILSCPKFTTESGETSWQISEITPISVSVTTPVRRPDGAPRSLKISSYGSPNPQLSWDPPIHPNGLVYYEISSTKAFSTETKTFEPIMISTIATEVDIACIPNQNDTKISFTVTAATFVKENISYLYGEAAELSNITCVQTEESNPHVGAIFLVIGILVLVFVFLAILCCYHRKKIREKWKSMIWTEVPQPKIESYVPDVTYTEQQANEQGLEAYLPIRDDQEANDDRPDPIFVNENLPSESSEREGIEGEASTMTGPRQYSEHEVKYVTDDGSVGERQKKYTHAQLIQQSTGENGASHNDASSASVSTSGLSLKQYVKVLQHNDTTTSPVLNSNQTQDTRQPVAFPTELSEDIDEEYVTEATPLTINHFRDDQTEQPQTRASQYRQFTEGDPEEYSGIWGNSREQTRESDQWPSFEVGDNRPIPGQEYVEDSSVQLTPRDNSPRYSLNELNCSGDALLNKSSYVADDANQSWRRASHSSGIQEDFEDLESGNMNNEMGKFLEGCFPRSSSYSVSKPSDKVLRERGNYGNNSNDSDEDAYVFDVETAI